MNSILILAAGSSTRMKECKLLLHFNGVSLIRNVINEAIKVGEHNIVVVTGAWRKEIETEIKDLPCTLFYNKAWESGMGKSIAEGIKYIEENLDSEYTIISVADQAYISEKIFNDLIQKYNSDSNNIIYSKYEKGSGPPVLFHRNFYTELRTLSNDEGAKPIVKKYMDETGNISFPKGYHDIDKPEDII